MTARDGQALYNLNLTPGIAFLYGPAGQEAHAQAIEHDRDKSYRMVANIVGKVCQGKTSLLRLLIGDDFNEHETSTVGIEHELVDTLGGTADAQRAWLKVDLRQANSDECDLIVGKHVRSRLRTILQDEKRKAEVMSFLKAMFLTYLMLFLYFTAAEVQWPTTLPWFPMMLTASFAVSGILLFDSLRNGFGMAVGVLCLVVYADSLFRWKMYNVFQDMAKSSGVAIAAIYAFLYYSLIHSIFAFFMGISVAMGMCFVMCLCIPPWSSTILDHNVFTDPHLHAFALSVLVGIWSIKHTKLIIVILTAVIAVTAACVPNSIVLTSISGLGCGFSHAIFIKIGIDTYVKFVNPILKSVAKERRNQRIIWYTVGIIPGILLCQYFEWIFSQYWIVYGFGGFLFVAFVEICHALLEGKIEAAPKPAFKNATKVLNSSTKVSLKFVLRDFAGHPLYHSVHHVYMMGHCVYLIVFNLLDAKRNFNNSFSEIIYWLQAIQVHGRYPSVRALIVGTHRDDPNLLPEDLETISDKLETSLPRHFYNIVVWNRLTNKPVFPVENSIRDEDDEDHYNLRQELFRIATEAMEQTYPIKYFYFYRVINYCRDNGKLIESIENIKELCDINECSVNEFGELDDVLNYFQGCGEVIYNPHDNSQNQLVVMDPGALVKIIVGLVRVAPQHERSPEFMFDWNTVSDLGICTKRLLEHIIRSSGHVSEEVDTESVISLLESLDLACKLNLGPDGLDITGEECFLLMPLLKDTLPYPQNYWEDCDSDIVIYIDFGPVVPKFVFSRLVCQCASESHIEVGPSGNYHINLSTSRALFVQSNNSHSYKLELLNKGSDLLPRQQLLKLVVRGAGPTTGMAFVTSVAQKVADIISRDFRTCRYRIGVLCPFEDEHDYCQTGEQHILPLFESNKTQPKEMFRQIQVLQKARPLVHIPETKKFWCRGRLIHFRFGQVAIGQQDHVGHGNQNTWRRKSGYEMSVIDLPPRLYSDICDDLDTTKVLNKDWKELAGLLNYTQHEVNVIQCRSPRDPCDALLQDWTSWAEDPSVLAFINILRQMDRLDTVRRLEQFVHGN